MFSIMINMHYTQNNKRSALYIVNVELQEKQEYLTLFRLLQANVGRTIKRNGQVFRISAKRCTKT